MKIDRCKLFGHNWKPAYISGEYNGIRVKFIGTYCKRCFRGYKELLDTIGVQTKQIYGTWEAKYFDNPRDMFNFVIFTPEQQRRLEQVVIHNPISPDDVVRIADYAGRLKCFGGNVTGILGACLAKHTRRS